MSDPTPSPFQAIRAESPPLPDSVVDPTPDRLLGRAGSGGAVAALGAVGAALPLALAWGGAASWIPAIAGAACLAALTLGIWLAQGPARRRTADFHRSLRSPDQATEWQARRPGAEIPFAGAMERLADPILLVAGGDLDDAAARRFVFANAAARALLRLQRDEGPLTTAVRVPEVLAAIDSALYRAEPGEAIYEPGGAQGRVWRAFALPLPPEGTSPPDGPRRTAVLSFRDETELRRGERTRADFLANASHELRTPLASLAGFIETLRGHARDDPAAREKFLGIMHLQALRMRRLIDDLLSLSRIEMGEHIPPSDTVDLAVAVIDVADALSPLAAERAVRILSDLPAAGEAEVVGDRDQILQVIQNLAENALKHTPPGGAMTLAVRADLDFAAAAAPLSSASGHRALLSPERIAARRYATVRITDAGPGIARENLSRLTERFYRVEGQKKGENAGTGLGLAIVKHIVNRHRGGLTVESEAGAGAIFTAYLPQGPRRDLET